MPRATSLAATLSRELGIEADLQSGARGVFDVAADGKLIFSKYKAQRFPQDAEIVSALRPLMGKE